MIHPDSRTLAWIEKVAKDNNVKDIAFAENAKAIITESMAQNFFID